MGIFVCLCWRSALARKWLAKNDQNCLFCQKSTTMTKKTRIPVIGVSGPVFGRYFCTNPNSKVRKSGAVGKAVRRFWFRWCLKIRLESHEWTQEENKWWICVSGILFWRGKSWPFNKKVRFCAILAVLLLYCYHREP